MTYVSPLTTRLPYFGRQICEYAIESVMRVSVYAIAAFQMIQGTALLISSNQEFIDPGVSACNDYLVATGSLYTKVFKVLPKLHGTLALASGIFAAAGSFSALGVVAFGISTQAFNLASLATFAIGKCVALTHSLHFVSVTSSFLRCPRLNKIRTSHQLGTLNAFSYLSLVAVGIMGAPKLASLIALGLALGTGGLKNSYDYFFFDLSCNC